MRRIRAALFLGLIGMALTTGLSGCIVREGGYGGRGEHAYGDDHAYGGEHYDRGGDHDDRGGWHGDRD